MTAGRESGNECRLVGWREEDEEDPRDWAFKEAGGAKASGEEGTMHTNDRE